MGRGATTIQPNQPSPRHTGFKAVSTGRSEGEQANTNQPPWSVIADLIRNPEVRGSGATTRQYQPLSPSPLMGEESKPVPVPDTGAEGENDATHRHNPENPLNPENPDSKQLSMKRGNTLYHPPPCGYCLEAGMTILTGLGGLCVRGGVWQSVLSFFGLESRFPSRRGCSLLR